MEESFWRDSEIAREPSRLPAATYNLTRILLARSPQACVFVPIRSMQYLAVIDREEIIFVDREGARQIELAWQRFDPHVRESLEDPVPYERVYYQEKARATMKRLPREFHLALEQLARKQVHVGPAKVLKLDRS
ncbi:hypothetical protein [Thiobacter aerophilum]|uniref:Uncharacterized protein n=1 Tax=Thiobacter aerophilum TaxID=3121275 RepID=A0ABV0EHC4_9BURK